MVRVTRASVGVPAYRRRRSRAYRYRSWISSRSSDPARDALAARGEVCPTRAVRGGPVLCGPDGNDTPATGVPRAARVWPAPTEDDAARRSKFAPGPIDAVVKWPNGKAYFFYGADYVRYDVKADKVDAGYPKSIAGQWKGLFTSDIDAGIEWGNGKVYFFKGDQYSRYDIKTDRVDPDYPKPIAGNWPGLFTDGIDAAVNWGNGKAYFFKGDQYIRFDIKTDRADAGFPKPIAGNWPGLFTSDIDDAVNWGNGKVYFFKGDEYTRYDIKTDRADAGYPLGIAAKWPGLHPTSACTCTHTQPQLCDWQRDDGQPHRHQGDDQDPLR